MGVVAYKLELLASIVFHISMLKKAIGNATLSQPLPPAPTENMEYGVELEEVLGILKGTKETKLLIRWKNLLDFESTWEPLSTIQGQFPTFHLEEKVKLKEDSNDKP